MSNIADLQINKKEVLSICIGIFPYAMSIVMIDGINTIPGGGVGIATILHFLTMQSIGRLNVIVNIPLMLIGTMVLGKKMLLYTGIAVFGSSMLTDLLMSVFHPDLGMSSLSITLLSAVLMGIGSGIIMSTGATFAGTTVIARLIMKKYPQIKAGTLLCVLDGMTVCIGVMVLGKINALFLSVIYTVVVTWMINLIMYILPRKWNETSLIC